MNKWWSKLKKLVSEKVSHPTHFFLSYKKISFQLIWLIVKNISFGKIYFGTKILVLLLELFF